MRPRLISAALGWPAVLLLLLACAPARSVAADLKLQAQLVWGTNDDHPPQGKDYKRVEPDIEKRLKNLPFKWANWFEVSRTNFPVPTGATKKVALSEKCQLEVKNLGNGEVEVVLIGKGKEVVRRKQALPKQDILVLGGNAPNSTAWLVILKVVE